MKFIVDMPDELVPQKQEIMSIDLYFIDGKLSGCTYPFEELEAKNDCISREVALFLAYDMSEIDGEHFTEPFMVVNVNDLQKLPSVTPAEKQEGILDKIRAEFISLYPKNYAGEPELGGSSCEFSLNKVLNIIDKYKAESEGRR